MAPARAVDEVMSRVLEDGALVDHASPLEGGFMRQVLTIAGLTALAAFVAVWTWLCVKGTVLAARQGRKAGWIQAAWTVWGAAIGLVVAAVTLAIAPSSSWWWLRVCRS